MFQLGNMYLLRSPVHFGLLLHVLLSGLLQTCPSKSRNRQTQTLAGQCVLESLKNQRTPFPMFPAGFDQASIFAWKWGLRDEIPGPSGEKRAPSWPNPNSHCVITNTEPVSPGRLSRRRVPPIVAWILSVRSTIVLDQRHPCTFSPLIGFH